MWGVLWAVNTWGGGMVQLFWVFFHLSRNENKILEMNKKKKNPKIKLNPSQPASHPRNFSTRFFEGVGHGAEM